VAAQSKDSEPCRMRQSAVIAGGLHMTNLDQIVALNRAQRQSETDGFTARRYKQFVRYFLADTRDVLDVGCNTGRGGAVMKALVPGLRLTGIDCVPERVAALDALTYSERICGYANAIPLTSDSFDAIVAGEFLQALPPDQVDGTLCEFFRLLRPGAVLLLTVPNPRYLKHRLKGITMLGGAILSQHYPESLRRRLRDIGFSGVKIRGSGRVSSLLGERFPLRSVYGSYLAQARKW
jgi:SAM-dependent methyltransferase